MRRIFLVVLCLIPAAAFSQETETPEERREREKQAAADRASSEGRGERGPLSSGRVVFRGGVSLYVNQAIIPGGNNTPAPVHMGVGAGVGYFVVDNLSLD